MTIEKNVILFQDLKVGYIFSLITELLMTERTYNKCLNIINAVSGFKCMVLNFLENDYFFFVKFLRKEIDEEYVLSLPNLFETFESLAQSHSIILKSLENRLQFWKTSNCTDDIIINDIFIQIIEAMPIYEKYAEKHLDILEKINFLLVSDKHFQNMYEEFELQKFCFIPIRFLLLKPLYRFLQYEYLLSSWINYINESKDRKMFDLNEQNGKFSSMLDFIGSITKKIRTYLSKSTNFVLLCEIQRDLDAFDDLVQYNRFFIRQGCLLKHSKAGLQQLIFILFSDYLIYAYKSAATQNFKVLGCMALNVLSVESLEHNTFLIFEEEKFITVSAATIDEKNIWLNELKTASACCSNFNASKLQKSMKKYGKYLNLISIYIAHPEKKCKKLYCS